MKKIDYMNIILWILWFALGLAIIIIGCPTRLSYASVWIVYLFESGIRIYQSLKGNKHDRYKA